MEDMDYGGQETGIFGNVFHIMEYLLVYAVLHPVASPTKRSLRVHVAIERNSCFFVCENASLEIMT